MSLYRGLMIASIGITAGVFWLDIPLGVPGEWVWPRLPLADDVWLELIPLSVSLVLLWVITWYGSRRIERCGSYERCGWLLALMLSGFMVHSGLRDLAPPFYRSAKAAWVLYYPGSSGYFTAARKIQDTRDFLKTYESEVRKGDVLHQGTHPPGLIVCFRGMIWVCTELKWVRAALIRTQPDELRAFFDLIEENAARRGTAFTESDRSVLWLAALIVQFCAVATVWPLYGLLRLYCDRTESWLVSALWPLIPAVSIFAPKSDALFPLLSCLVLGFWLHGLRRKSLLNCAISASLFWFGMTLSLAMLPVGLFACLMSIWMLLMETGGTSRHQFLKEIGLGLLAGGAVFIALVSLTWWLTSCNLWSIWYWNYRNHAGFYLQYTRTYWCWLLVNPVELALAMGLPIVLAGLAETGRLIRTPKAPELGPVWCSLASWGVLWISGKNMGEAARLWIFLMPWLLWSTGLILHGKPASNDRMQDQFTTWRWIWLSQMLCAVLTVTRVVGFHAAPGSGS